MYGGVTENVFFPKMFGNFNLGPECLMEISGELWNQPCQLNFVLFIKLTSSFCTWEKSSFFIIPTCQLP